MANRFWVGGTANWDGTAGTKWALTSGGAGGQAVPTSADDVFFDAASGAVTCTIAAGNTGAKSITCTGFTGTLSFSATVALSGNLTLVAGMTVTGSGSIQFIATGTITSAGKTLGAITVIGSGITVDLADALTSSGAVTVTQGTFTTNNYAVTATSLSSNNSNARTINLGSSTVTLTAAGASTWNTAVTTNLTFNAGTSQINLASTTTSTLAAGGLVFYNVAFTGVRTTSNFPGSSVTGANTFNNLSFTGPSSPAVVQVTFNSPQTINGTLSTTGTAGNRRIWFSGATYGIAQTLTINSAPSLTDADFRDIYVIGTAAPISGTRIGDLRGIRGITASTPKTVYWNLAAGGTWLDNAWAATSGGAVSADNFPLAQDTVVIENTGLNTSGVVALSTTLPYTGTVDMSGRTNAMTLAINACSIYGNWINGSGTAFIGSTALTFSGRNTQTITSAGKTFSCPITVDSYGGTVELADALNIGSNTLTVTNGTFDTKNYNVTAGSLSSSNSNVRTINLGSSTLTFSGNPIAFSTNTNLTFNAGTSTIIGTSSGGSLVGGSATTGVTFYDVAINSAAGGTPSMNGLNTFRNLTIGAPSTAGLISLLIQANQTITGTLTCAGATAVRRVFLCSDTLGTTRTLTVNSLSAQDCDFRDITIAGAAAGSSPTRAGNCGGNAGITFPAAKTVYWNLAGTQNWSATAWAPGSGGTPDINNFPLAQDTAVFDNTGSAGTVTVNAVWNIGTLSSGTRSTAWTFQTSAGANVHGDWTYGSGVTTSNNNNPVTFLKRSGTQTLTTSGKTFGDRIIVDGISGILQLGDALTCQFTITLTSGTFDAVTYNVTTGLFSGGGASTLKMGSGTWTLSGIGTVWNMGSAGASFNLYKGTANIVLSNTTTGSRTFDGSGFSFGKLTIGGATGTSTLTINGSGQFTELASTKTVAHTIALGTTTQTFGAWTVTGTVGNVVTVTGTAALTIAGAAVSGVDYLALGTTTVSATSPGEFYAGANSTATGAAAPLYLTAKPADSTRYWVGGTGNWSDTARWSTTSGTGSGASVPRSHDDVVFDSGSNATAYTATVNAVTGGIRMKALTITGPASGNVTLAGSTAMDGIHGNVSLPATGLTRTYTGAITLSGSATGRTINTNGVVLGSTININGVGCEWTLGGAINSNSFQIINGTFSTNNYNLTTQGIASNYTNSRTVNLGSSTLSMSGFNQPLILGTSENARAALTFNAGTSQISIGASDFTFSGNNQTFYNVTFTSTSTGTFTINGVNVFNNVSVTGITAAGLKVVSLTANQTINGTLTLSAGTDATMRTFVRSDTIGTTRTLTCAAFSGTDADFRDITIAGAAAPVSGTRLGDCKGNSGITFGAGVTRYWNLVGGGNWSATGWAATSGGSPAANNFPLAQDTCLFEATGLNSGSTITVFAAYNIGSIDMSARTSNTMTLATSASPTIYGNWINGTGTTLSGTNTLTFAGRGSQTITSAGRTFTQGFTIQTPGGSVTLQDAFVSNRDSSVALSPVTGTFDANGFNVTLSAANSGMASGGSLTRTIAVGSGTWTIAGASTAWNAAATNLTVTGTGTISLTSASAKQFTGGGISYSGITLNQGGAGTLTITGNNTFANITNSYKTTGATNITLGTTTQRVAQFTAAGEAGRVLTVQGTSASSPATLILTGATDPNVDYLAITGVRAYDLTDTWYAGTNSTNNGSLGWIFAAGAVVTAYLGNFFAFF